MRGDLNVASDKLESANSPYTCILFFGFFVDDTMASWLKNVFILEKEAKPKA